MSQFDNPFATRPPVGTSPDFERILALPRRTLIAEGTPEAEALIDLITERYARDNHACRCAQIDPQRHAKEGCIKRLKLAQAHLLREIGMVGGALGAVGVGHGKTLVGLLAPYAFGLQNNQKAVMFVPPRNVGQLWRDHTYYGEHFVMPSIQADGQPAIRRAGQPMLYVMSYSKISRPESTTWLEGINPDVILSDEVHRLRDSDTATTKRVLRYFRAHPDTRFAGWSGSLTAKSITDYSHLAALALRMGSPLPLDPAVVDDWAGAIDPTDNTTDPGVLMRFCNPGESLYDGIGRRLADTYGFITTPEQSSNVQFSISERKAPAIPDAVHKALRSVRTYIRPDGEELIDAASRAKCAIEVAQGFHYRWIFPKHEFPRDEPLVDAWFAARKAWFKEVRYKLQLGGAHMDSEKLVTDAAMRFYGDLPANPKLPSWKCSAWPVWRDIRNLVHPETDTVRIDDFLVQDAAKWARENVGIIWYEHQAFGKWLQEVTGLPRYGGGKKSELALSKEKGDRSIICSVKANGTGVNGLQFIFNKQLITSPPSSPSIWEQLLGRTIRSGQDKAVETLIYKHTPELAKNIDTALRSALYVGRTLRSSQKLRVGYQTKKVS